MFGFLKDKLKSWASKLKSEEEPLKLKEKKPKQTKEKKEKLKKEKKEKPAKEKKVPKKSKKQLKVEKKEKELKETPQIQESVEQIVGEEHREISKEQTSEISASEQKQKKGFFSFLRKDKTLQEQEKAQKLGESILKETDHELTKKLYEHGEAKEEVEETKKEEVAHAGVSSAEQKEQKEQEEPEEKHSFFDRFRTKLDEEKFNELFQELELILLQNNVALEVVDEIRKSLKEQLIGRTLKDIDIEKSLNIAIEKVLIEPPDFLREIKTTLTQKQPFVIAFVGINGSGKTTTIAKTAHMLKKAGLSVVLAAADTFRAAAIQQLEEHASRLKVPIVKKDYGTDPAAVGFDAIAYAKKHHTDVVLIDTAGRMNTKDSLMKEMEKIIRVCKPDMKIFIGESITGNDATQQAKDFNDSIDLSGIILSKADVDEKAGAILSISYVTKKPIFFLGTGQTYDDLSPFNKKEIMKRLGL